MQTQRQIILSSQSSLNISRAYIKIAIRNAIDNNKCSSKEELEKDIWVIEALDQIINSEVLDVTSEGVETILDEEMNNAKF